MANLYQCKCGAPLEVSLDGKTGTCPFCGATVVFPKAGFQRMNKANELRQRREFDQAEGIYRSLTIAFPDDPEIWWNIVLCEYGIEYVKEVKDGVEKMIPTINRMKYESIFELDAYQKALEFSDAETKAIYQAEAQRIEDIQKRLQEIVAKEEKYDIFISFKDKDDETGERTLDSALAQEIYDALTKEGYKVFFSRITLRRMIGQEFEPKIFAALNSAAMMIVVGCAKKHVEATWVKNEWSRYLKLMEKDADKYLLPVYAVMKADDLPEKLAPMEGIEANGVSYMKLILKNVGERIGYKKEQRQEEQLVQDIAILEDDEVRRRTERGFNALKMGRYSDAGNYFEDALDLNVNYGLAWWGKLAVATKNFSVKCDVLSDTERKMYFDRAVANSKKSDNERFEQQVENLTQSWRDEQVDVAMKGYLQKTKNMGYIFTESEYEKTERWQEILKLEKKILGIAVGEKKEEVAQQFEDYHKKQEHYKQLKGEFEQFEKENKKICDDMYWRTKEYAQAKEISENVKTDLVAICFYAIGSVIAFAISHFIEVVKFIGGFLLILMGICVISLIKDGIVQIFRRGESKRRTEQAQAELQEVIARRNQRVEKLESLCFGMQERFSDVASYILPQNLQEYINKCKEELLKEYEEK